MFKNWSITKKLIFSFGIVIFITFVASWGTLYIFHIINTDLKDLRGRTLKIDNTDELRDRILTDVQLNITKMLLTEDVEKRKKIYNEILNGREVYKRHLDFLKRITRSNEGKKS